jgi:hypothetical protein
MRLQRVRKVPLGAKKMDKLNINNNLIATYKIAPNKEFGGYTHSLKTREDKNIDNIDDLLRFIQKEPFSIGLINSADDYQIDKFSIAGCDLIDYI